MDDCCVVDEVLACQCCVVFFLHVCFDGSVLLLHCEASRQSGPRESNITVVPKPTIFGRAIKLVHYVGSHETLCFRWVVAHDQVFCLCVLIVDM